MLPTEMRIHIFVFCLKTSVNSSMSPRRRRGSMPFITKTGISLDHESVLYTPSFETETHFLLDATSNRLKDVCLQQFCSYFFSALSELNFCPGLTT